MAHAITFDTLAYAKKFIAAGFTQQQAEAQAETFAEIIDEQLVSRQHLDLRLKEMEISLRRDMAEMKTDIIKWVAAMLIAQAAIVATLVKLL